MAEHSAKANYRKVTVPKNIKYRSDNSNSRIAGVKPESFLEYSHPEYEDPGPDEIREVLSYGNLTGSAAGNLLGVNSRTIRKWTGGEQKMPYSAWKLLLKSLEENKE